MLKEILEAVITESSKSVVTQELPQIEGIAIDKDQGFAVAF